MVLSFVWNYSISNLLVFQTPRQQAAKADSVPDRAPAISTSPVIHWHLPFKLNTSRRLKADLAEFFYAWLTPRESPQVAAARYEKAKHL